MRYSVTPVGRLLGAGDDRSEGGQHQQHLQRYAQSRWGAPMGEARPVTWEPASPRFARQHRVEHVEVGESRHESHEHDTQALIERESGHKEGDSGHAHIERSPEYPARMTRVVPVRHQIEEEVQNEGGENGEPHSQRAPHAQRHAGEAMYSHPHE